MTRYKKYINSILVELHQKKLLTSINPVNQFNDDPKLFHYSAKAILTKENTDGKRVNIQASGISFSSREFALFKCLAEVVERLGCTTYSKDDFLQASYVDLLRNRRNAFDPQIKGMPRNMRERKFRWIESFDIVSQKKICLPAQCIFLNYIYNKETHLYPEVTTTGCAGGFNHETALLRGIYEVIEREAYLAVFLTMSTPPHIEITKYNNPLVKTILNICKRYYLELHVFDITNDLQIPTFLTLLVDRSGIGQAFTAGLKSHINPIEGLIGSIEEALNTRPWYRQNMNKKKTTHFIGDYVTIDSFEKRSLFWSSTQRLHELSFLLNAPFSPWKYTTEKKSSTNQLLFIKDIFSKKGFPIYYTDITPRKIFTMDYFVYNVFIPNLQQFYIDESAKQINHTRLQTIAMYFGKEKFNLNPLPHFFL